MQITHTHCGGKHIRNISFIKPSAFIYMYIYIYIYIYSLAISLGISIAFLCLLFANLFCTLFCLPSYYHLCERRLSPGQGYGECLVLGVAVHRRPPLPSLVFPVHQMPFQENAGQSVCVCVCEIPVVASVCRRFVFVFILLGWFVCLLCRLPSLARWICHSPPPFHSPPFRLHFPPPWRPCQNFANIAYFKGPVEMAILAFHRTWRSLANVPRITHFPL